MSLQNNNDQELILDDFFPYRLTELQSAISHNIADVYSGKFDLSRQQWRILATLGDHNKSTDNQMLSAKQLGQLTNLDKMQTSRAIVKLEEQLLVTKTADDRDKRSILIALTEKGHEVYQDIVPLVLEREQQLLSVLTQNQQQQLENLMNKLLKQALTTKR